MPEDMKKKWHSVSNVDLHKGIAVLYFANSSVNPLVYAIGMQEFRKALGNLVSRQSHAKEQRQRRGGYHSQQQTMLKL